MRNNGFDYCITLRVHVCLGVVITVFVHVGLGVVKGVVTVAAMFVRMKCENQCTVCEWRVLPHVTDNASTSDDISGGRWAREQRPCNNDSALLVCNRHEIARVKADEEKLSCRRALHPPFDSTEVTQLHVVDGLDLEPRVSLTGEEVSAMRYCYLYPIVNCMITST